MLEMILIVGSEGSGKRTFAESLGYTKEEMADAVIDEKPVIYHLEKMVFANPEIGDEILPQLLEKEAVICCEVGSGVIPIVRAERAGREACGRLCVLLAREADAVVRMTCGIPTVIKGSIQ